MLNVSDKCRIMIVEDEAVLSEIDANEFVYGDLGDVNFVVPGAADSGNMYTVVAEFQKIY